MVSDGAGGVIVVWVDYQDINDNNDDNLYAQRFNANGQAQWAAGGVVLSSGTDFVYWLRAVSDGQGGVIVTWEDDRDVSGVPNIYAQRLDADGNQMFGANDLPISTAVNGQIRPELTSDGQGGAIITWIDERTSSLGDIYAQRVNINGVVQWTTNGVPVSTAQNDQIFPRLIPDDSGGAIIAWTDYRNDTSPTGGDIYAQRLNASGVAQWTADGIVISDNLSSQKAQRIVTDEAGGALIFWEDHRRSRGDIYAQRVNAAGTTLWTEDGLPIGDSSDNHRFPLVEPDGSGGALVAWMLDAPVGSGLYGQRVTGNGDVLWEAGRGIPVSSWVPGQTQWAIAATSDAGLVIAWTDGRNGNDDIFAQKLQQNDPGQTAVALSGPSTGFINSNYTFAAAVTPLTTTVPMTYSWQATDQIAITRTAGITDAISFTWVTTGTKTITVTATNIDGSVTSQPYIIAINTASEAIYLPVILK